MTYGAQSEQSGSTAIVGTSMQSLPQLLIADKALRGWPSTFSHCLTTNLLTVLRINSVSVILCRKVPSGFLILCHDYAINEAVNLPCTGSQPVNVTINSGHQPALTPALSEHLAGLLPSGALRLRLR